jgi:S-adenosylmethionine hydrolase
MRQTRRTPASTTSARPIITLTTDFGLRDSYVAAMKAVLLREAPDARLIDVTHLVPRHDILCGSITLERAVDGFPPGTVHLAVVDPGVGTDRRILVCEINGQQVVCPDNGLITWSWRLHNGGRAHELTWRPARVPSATFHGRDIMAPAAARIALGEKLGDLARPIDDPVLLDVAPAVLDEPRGLVIQIDQFGNATTNIPYDHLRARNGAVEVRIKGRRIGRLKRTYCDVAPGKALALIGSSGLLEIAVRDGSAERDLRVRVGDEVVIR